MEGDTAVKAKPQPQRRPVDPASTPVAAPASKPAPLEPISEAEPDQAEPAAAPPTMARPSDTPPPPSPEDRGSKRAALLRALQGSDDILLEPDAGHEPTVTEPVAMDEAVAFALENNFGAKAARAKTEATRWELVGGFGQYMPRIDAEYRTGKQTSSPSSFHTVTAANTYAIVPKNDHPTWSSSVTLRQPLADVSIISDILARSYTLDAAAADEVGVREKLALDTISSFFRLIQSRLNIAFARNYKVALDRMGQRMQDRVSGGGASGVELDRITARAVSAKSAEIEAQAESVAASVEFRRLTGISPLKLRMPTSLMPNIPETVDKILIKALRGNPDYLAAQARTDAALVSTGKAFSGLLPKVTLEAGRSTTWNNGGIANETAPAVTPSELFPKSSNKYIATVFTWTLNGGVDLGQGMANAALARQASAIATDTRMRLEESVRVGFSSLNGANSRVEALAQAVESNTRVAASFEEQYASGSRQLLDLLDAYERLYQSQTELARLLVAEATGGFLIRRQMGELVDAILSRDRE